MANSLLSIFHKESVVWFGFVLSRQILWLVSRCPPCDHRWGFLEMPGPKVCTAGIEDVMLGLIHA